MKFIIAATLIAVAAGSALRTGKTPCTLVNPDFNCFEATEVFNGVNMGNNVVSRCCHGAKGKDNFDQQSNIKGCDGLPSRAGGTVCCAPSPFKKNKGEGKCVTHDDVWDKETKYEKDKKEQEGAGAKAEKDKATAARGKKRHSDQRVVQEAHHDDAWKDFPG